jgi:hypothetical protein
LVERFNGIEEVSGSIPLHSTSSLSASWRGSSALLKAKGQPDAWKIAACAQAH